MDIANRRRDRHREADRQRRRHNAYTAVDETNFDDDDVTDDDYDVTNGEENEFTAARISVAIPGRVNKSRSFLSPSSPPPSASATSQRRSASELTIAFEGEVYVFPAVSPDKVQAVLVLLGGRDASTSVPTSEFLVQQHDTKLDEIQQTSPSKATMSSSDNAVVRPMSFEGDYPAHTKLKSDQREVVFKILCSNDIAGGLIGRGGSIVRALQEESGAHISVGAPITNCDERSVTVTSKENVDSRYSSAQLAVILVFSRFAEAAIEKGLDTGSNKGPSFARLLVPSNQIGCLLGKGGSIVSEMRKATGANIRILKGKQVPKCASGDDQVVEITGQFVKIQDALHQVTSRLRSNLYPSNATSISGRFRDSTVGINRSFATSQATDRLSTMRQGVESLNSSHRSYHSPLARSQSSKANEVNSRTFENLGRGSVPANGGSEHSRPAIVTNTTLEILVPEDAISSIYGENEKNLMRIRQISGAKVTVHESQPGTRDSTVVISGTPEETQAAQSLLHAFLLSGSS